MENTFIGATVTEEGNTSIIGAPLFGGKGCANTKPHTGADNAVGAKNIEINIGHMHGTADTTANTTDAAKSSAIIPFKSAPLAMQWPWPRWWVVIKSFC